MSTNEITNTIIYLLSNKYLIGGNRIGIKNFLTSHDSSHCRETVLNINYNRATSDVGHATTGC